MIKIDNLSFSYGKKPLFKNMSLELGPGLYGLLGMNGAGKSTLMKIISGQLRTDKTRCSTLGYEPFKRSPEMLEQIYYLPEEFNLPSIKAEKYLSIMKEFYPGFDLEFFSKSAQEFEVDITSNFKDMSYGQKKKFMICFGLATFTKILLLDEPTNGLDIPSKSTFRKLVSSGALDGRIIVISTHQVRDMENLIDPVIIIDQGEIIFNYSMATILDNFSVEKFTELPESKEVIFHKKILGGYMVAVHEKGESGNHMDMEFLFEMAISSNKKINEVIEGEKF